MRIYFEVYGSNVEDLPTGYQEVSCHIIFDLKMGNSFHHKEQIVAGIQNNTTPSLFTYSPLVYWDSVMIFLIMDELNDLKVILCDIHNAYLTAKFLENIWNVAGPEFGYD